LSESTKQPGEGLWIGLRRRKVVQWGIAYVAAAWGLLQGLAYLSTVFQWPAQLQRPATVAFMAGLPIALVIAWFHGDQGHQRVSSREFAILTVLLLLGGGLFWWVGQMPATRAGTATTPTAVQAPISALAGMSIAVLPFINISEDPANEYFSDGLSEELLNVLARVPELKVIARTSSFSYKGRPVPIADIARELNVAHVLEGSVRKAGNRVRVSATLIRSADSSNLWSETYDHAVDDSFEVQDEIARKVVAALRIKLLADVTGGLDAGGTQVGEAYEAFLRGQYERNQGNAPEMLAAAVAAFDRAIELDPGYAKARAARAFTIGNQAMNAYVPFDEGFGDARDEALRAIELAPELADGYRVLARIKLYGYRDLAGAREMLALARGVGGEDAARLRLEMDLALREGRYNEAIEAARRVTVLDPIAPQSHTTLGIMLWYDRRFDEAQTAADRGLALAPDRPGGRYVTAVIALSRGNAARAVADCEQESIDWQKKSCLAIAYRRVGRAADAKRQLTELQQESGDGFAYQYAQIYAQWGDAAEAFRWLAIAEKVKDPGLILANGDPLLDPIRQDARFAELIGRLGLDAG